MEKIPNQNSLKEIIRSNIAFIADVTNIITGITNVITISTAHIDKTNEILNSIYGKEGIFERVELINERLNKTRNDNKRLIKQRFFKLHLREIFNIIGFVDKIAKRGQKINQVALEAAIKTVNAANHIISILDNVKVSITLPIKIDIMRLSFFKFRQGVLRNVHLTGAYLLKHAKTILIGFPMIKLILLQIINLVNVINSMKLSELLLTNIKIELLDNVTLVTKKIFEAFRIITRKATSYKISTLARTILLSAAMAAAFKSLAIIKDSVELIEELFEVKLKFWDHVIVSTKKIFEVFKIITQHAVSYKITTLAKTIVLATSMAIVFKMFAIIKDSVNIFKTFISSALKLWDKVLIGTKKIFNIFLVITQHAGSYKITTLIKTVVNMVFITIIFRMFKDMYKFATIAALLSVPFSICGVPFLLSLIILYFVLETLIYISNLLPKDTILKMLYIVGVTAVLCLIGIELFALALTGKTVLENFGYILGILLAITAVVILIIPLCLLGMALTFIGPIAIGGMFSLVGMISAVVAVAYALKILELIQLDKTIIMNNVNTVLTVCRTIIDMLFSGSDDDAFDSISKSKSWLGLIINIGKGATDLIKMLAASAILTFTLISVTLILFTVAILKVLEYIPLNKNKVLTSVNSVISIARFITDTVFGKYEYNENTGKTEKTKTNFIERFFNGIGSLISAVAGSVMLVSTLISVGSILLISFALKALETQVFKETSIKDNITTIINTCKLVIDTVNAPSDTKKENKKDGIIGKLLDFVLPSNLKYAIDALISMPFLAFTWISIGMIRGIANGLILLQNLPKLDNVKANTDSMLLICKDVITNVTKHDFKIKDIKNNFKAIKHIKRLIKKLVSIADIENADINKFNTNTLYIQNAIKSVSKNILPTLKTLPETSKSSRIVLSIKDITTVLKHLTEFAKVSVNDVSIGLGNYITIINTIVKKIDNKVVTRRRRYKNALENLAKYSDLMRGVTSLVNTSIADFSGINVDNHERFIDNNIKFLNAIDNIDSRKLKQTKDLYKQLRKFSESINGNFDELAAVLSEQLLPVFEELKEILEKIPDTLNSGFQNTSASIAATNMVPNQNNVTAQVVRENPSLSKSDLELEVQRRLNAYNAAEANGMISKIDEMLNLLKGYSGYVKVKTV